mmetsp:Transcript_28692/g.73327  ORF Transcript_28692/g.73327 Transcript_28692/m.73327 type:complete len:220 (-) Transcript_28692:4097-4756(-)
MAFVVDAHRVEEVTDLAAVHLNEGRRGPVCCAPPPAPGKRGFVLVEGGKRGIGPIIRRKRHEGRKDEIFGRGERNRKGGLFFQIGTQYLVCEMHGGPKDIRGRRGFRVEDHERVHRLLASRSHVAASLGGMCVIPHTVNDVVLYDAAFSQTGNQLVKIENPGIGLRRGEVQGPPDFGGVHRRDVLLLPLRTQVRRKDESPLFLSFFFFLSGPSLCLLVP